MKLAIMTWYHYRNYGTALQAAALTRVLRDLGHEPQMICYKPCGYHRTVLDYSAAAFAKRVFKKITKRSRATNESHFCDAEKDKLFQEFLDECITFTEPCQTKADLEGLNDQFDAFICGSDQIWSPLNFDPKYYLDFVHDPMKKIAYAPSLGVERIEDKYIRAEITALLTNFGSLSVRETAGQKLIKELSGKDSRVVLDPTLLLTASQWEARFDKESAKDKKSYLLVYMLGNNGAHLDAARKTAGRLGLELRVIPVHKSDLTHDGCITDAVGPQEFLELIHNASYVCTDSFHGMIFSLIFHRPFTAFVRFEKDDARNQNSRIFNLLSMVEMSDRLMVGDDWTAIADSEPDFTNADRVLNEQRDSSIQYITDALTIAAKTKKQNLSVMKQNSLCCGCGACKSVCPVSAVRIELNDKGFWGAVVDEKKCIGCGKCKAVCPFCTPTLNVPIKTAKLYSFKCNEPDTLLRSSSGGAAYSIARILIRQGYCVAGCKYDTELQQAVHTIVTNEAELSVLQGSKYIQSDFAETLDELKKLTSPIALFATPCQIAAARRVLAGRKDVVYIDLVCHGVPSAHLFRKYREHIHSVSNVDINHMTMDFRYKPKSWAHIHLHATDGKHEYCCEKENDPFFRMFELGGCYNETCYECRWRASSEADIRLGDYWGPRFKDDPTGVSMFVCLTKIGRDIMGQLCSEKTGTIIEQPMDDYLTYQQKTNYPKPVFYASLISELGNTKINIADIAEKYAFPFENKRLSRGEYFKYLFKMMTYGK